MIELNLLKLAAASRVLIHSPPVNVAQCQTLIIIQWPTNTAESGVFMTLDFYLEAFLFKWYELGIMRLKLYIMNIKGVFLAV